MEDLKAEIKLLKAQLEEAHVDCIRLQQEINCLRMEPCQLPHCQKREAVLMAHLRTADKLVFQRQVDRDAWRQMASTMLDEIRCNCTVETVKRYEDAFATFAGQPKIKGAAKQMSEQEIRNSKIMLGQPEKPRPGVKEAEQLFRSQGQPDGGSPKGTAEGDGGREL